MRNDLCQSDMMTETGDREVIQQDTLPTKIRLSRRAARVRAVDSDLRANYRRGDRDTLLQYYICSLFIFFFCSHFFSAHVE